MRGKTKHSDDEDDSTKLGTTGYPQAKTNEGKEQEQDDEHAKLRASISLAKDGIKQMKAVVKDS